LTVSALSDVERRFFEELNTRGVKYMVVGLTAAIAQGANTVTRDIDLWFERSRGRGRRDLGVGLRDDAGQAGRSPR
jgi:hypothetical protein